MEKEKEKKPVKRGRGRPRLKENSNDLTSEKRPRGRPRKKQSNSEIKSDNENKKKGTRGRKKKSIIVVNSDIPSLNLEDLVSDDEDLIIHIPIDDLNEDEINFDKIDHLFDYYMPENVPTPSFDKDGNVHSINVKNLENPDIEIPDPIPIEPPLKYELFFPSDNENDIEKVKVNENEMKKITGEQFVGSVYTERYGKYEDNLFTKISIYNLKQPIVNDGKYLCWWCCHSFRGIVIPLPYYYIEPVKKRSPIFVNKPNDIDIKIFNNKYEYENELKEPFFKVKGCFCSYNCSKSYNRHMTKDHRMIYRESLIYFFYKKMSCDNVFKKIPMAPPRETLLAFGGYLHITQFRANTDTEYKILNNPKVSYVNVTIEESKHEKHTCIPGNLNKGKKHLRSKQPKRANTLLNYK